MFQITTDYHSARWLLTCPVFSVDIETTTAVPMDSEWDDLDASDASYGLSFVTDITVVSFFHPDHDPVVIRNPYLPEHRAFIRSIFEREHYTIIGHNVIFDLRSLGGHLGFDLLRHGIKVWDTERMSLALMFGKPRDREASSTTESELSLEALVTRNNLYRNEIEREFYEAMKSYRRSLSQMPLILHELPPDSILWKFVGGYPADHAELGTVISADECEIYANRIVDLYVALDTLYTFRLYERHLIYISEVKDKNAKLPVYRRVENMGQVQVVQSHELRIPKWPQIESLVEWDQRISWASAVQAIRGVGFDKNYALRKRGEYEQMAAEALEQVLTIADESNPYDGWEQTFQTVYWYYRMLETLKAETKYSSPDYKGERAWVHWDLYPVEEALIQRCLVFDKAASEEDDVARRQFWSDWLLEASPSWTRAQLKKAVQADKSEVPYIDIFNFVREQSVWHTDDEVVVDYLTRTKLNWLEHYYTLREKLTSEKTISKGLWIPYHLFVVCRIPIPSEEDFRGNSGIVTKKHGQRVRAFDGDNNPNFSYRNLALRERLMSAGKPAMEFYLLQDGDEAPNFNHFRRFVEADSNVQRLNEYMGHASRDGRIHSAISNVARTTRGRSRAPNLQNLPMRGEDAGFRGYLIAPGPRRMVEIDISNAENVHGAVISRDDAFAYAVMSLDFHALMRDEYWPDLMEKLKAQAAASDHEAVKLLKFYRDMSKRVTFGDFYGAGARKISRELRCTIEEAAAIKKRKEQAFPLVTEKRKEIEDTCKARVRQGFYPAFISLWDGSRVQVDSHVSQFEVNTYMTWNYTLQGGVARIVARARTEMVETEIDMPRLDDGLPMNFIGMDVHDSLVCCVVEDEEQYKPYVQMVIVRLCSQVPEKALQRTTPYLRYVAEVGPENAEKWGWRDGQAYPFSLDHFVNQWGYWELPEELLAKPPRDREAPSWKGPMHEGWSVDREVAELRHSHEENTRKDIARENGNNSAVKVETVGEEWVQLMQILNFLSSMSQSFPEHKTTADHLLKARRITYLDKEGKEKQTEPLNFANFMAAAQGLTGLGYDIPLYQENLLQIHEVLHLRRMLEDWLQMVQTWTSQHGEEYLPKAGADRVRKILGGGTTERRLR